MPFTKVFGTTAGAWTTETLWRKISLRNPSFAWTLSGSGTAEYYVRLAPTTNPGFAASPPTTNGVFIGGSAATKGTLGSLTSGQWGYGDNDTLGYSTVYVRIGSDPDASAIDHVQFQQMPQAGEHVRFAADSASIDSATGLDQSALAIGDFIVEEGYAGTIGSAVLGYLSIDPDRFEFNGVAECWINLHTAAISPQIYGTAASGEGLRGLYLKGSALAVLNVMGGNVGLAINGGETSTVTTARVLGGQTTLWLGNGVTITNLHQYGGEVNAKCGITTIILYEGRLNSQENGAMGTITQHGGEYVWQSSGNITTHNVYGGTFDEMQSGAARTLTTRNLYRGNSNIQRNKEAVTVTTDVTQESLSISTSASGGGGGRGFI